jgi:hypothetical protein
MATSEERRPAPAAEYYYRRALSLPEMLKAAAVGVGAGLATFYVVRRLLERTPLLVERGLPAPARPRVPARRRADGARGG